MVVFRELETVLGELVVTVEVSCDYLSSPWVMETPLADKSMDRCQLPTLLPNVSAQSRAFISGRSKHMAW